MPTVEQPKTEKPQPEGVPEKTWAKMLRVAAADERRDPKPKPYVEFGLVLEPDEGVEVAEGEVVTRTWVIVRGLDRVGTLSQVSKGAKTVRYAALRDPAEEGAERKVLPTIEDTSYLRVMRALAEGPLKGRRDVKP